MWDQFLWIVVAGGVLAFFTAYGIGANDVANAFATSVGAKSLTMRQAIIIAAFCEFAGAVLMGAQVTDTIRKGIADPAMFNEQPEILMFGMLCVIAATGVWLILASYLELPVSTTHSVIGGIIGMAITAHGFGAVVWSGLSDEFPYVHGVAAIVASWVVSPFMTAIMAISVFVFVRHFSLKHEEEISRRRALILFPVLVGVTIAICAFFIISKGFSREFDFNGKRQTVYELLGNGGTAGACVGLGFLVAIILQLFFVPELKKRMAKIAERDVEASPSPSGTSADLEENLLDEEDVREPSVSPQLKAKKKAFFNQDLHAVISEDESVQNIHLASRSYDPATEEAFSYLQVFTAMCVSFAHGANDVANSIGPFAAIYAIYKYEAEMTKSEVPIWILVLGGSGIVVGLATYGYKIMRAIGVKLVKMSPSRGFTIELSVATVIVLGSRFGIPLSTTHCQVGGSVGIGLVENAKHGVNYKLLGRVLVGWVVTMVVVGLTTAALFAEAVYAPSVFSATSNDRYQQGVGNAIDTLTTLLPSEEQQGILDTSLTLEAKRIDVSVKQMELLERVVQEIKGICPAV